MDYITVQDKMTIVKEEIWHLERLLNEANTRKRYIARTRGNQTWWDWLLEWAGY